MNAKFEYEKIYVTHSFERLGLFECLKNTFQINTVVYIGSSIHITPSFVFQNVTYLDNSALTKYFFNKKEELIAYINTRKQYTSNPYIQFMEADYRQDKLLPENKYDLVLTINSPGSFEAAARLVKTKGLILYLPLPQEAHGITLHDKIEITGFIHKKDKKYIFEKNENIQRLKKKHSKNLIFVEDNEYYVYTKAL